MRLLELITSTRPLVWLRILHLCLLFILTLYASPLSAQQFDADVVFHTDRLSLEEVDYIKGIDADIQNLINRKSWQGTKYNYTLPVRIELFFEKGHKGHIYHKYSASLMVALRSGMQLREKKWDFYIDSYKPLRIGDPYEPFCGLIEYSLWVCLGFEADRFSPLGGQEFYNKAKLVADKARFETKYSLGWDVREFSMSHFMSLSSESQSSISLRLRTSSLRSIKLMI